MQTNNKRVVKLSSCSSSSDNRRTHEVTAADVLRAVVVGTEEVVGLTELATADLKPKTRRDDASGGSFVDERIVRSQLTKE